MSESAKALEISQQELEKRLEALQLQHQQDSTNMQAQLDDADSHSKTLQREVDSDLCLACANSKKKELFSLYCFRKCCMEPKWMSHWNFRSFLSVQPFVIILGSALSAVLYLKYFVLSAV